MNNNLSVKYTIFLVAYSISAGILASAFMASYSLLSAETVDSTPFIYQFEYSEPYEDITPNQTKLIG